MSARLMHLSRYRSLRRGPVKFAGLAFATVLALSACGAGETADTAAAAKPKIDAPEISASLSPMDQAEAYDKAVGKASTNYKIAALNTCSDLNAWCQAMSKYQKEAAQKYGITLEVYDAAFDPAKQLRQVQDAIAKGGYDGFIFQPVAAAPGCQMIKLLLDTGLPVQQANSPVCQDKDYHEGTTGMVATSTEAYYGKYLEHIFDSCDGKPCKAAVIGGVAGQDGWRRLQAAIKDTSAKYPNVEIVVEQPADYDPNKALRITQDALTAHSDVSVIISAYDEMSRGVLQALGDAGRKVGKDVKLFSIGGTPYGLSQVKAGNFTATVQSDPKPEGWFSVVELVRALDTGQQTKGWSSTGDWDGIKDGPGSEILTVENVDRYTPSYG
ncbi:sugar ABC transporter substrate-binding protein [Nonomuraea cavernae]|uniref:Sugar ABC transporter substrate-binding protein n=1 Tax=Nonomuraea cavernae TaxID=2045107 RepID=A0A918DET7_9ACTN|nr:sugar ABC transporter substrate-binding protein [Nonomuraea cavernae]